jgi:multiple sugar transport system substrate-binding protein
MFFDWTITGNWSWQGLLFSHGGSMLNADESKVAFAEDPGQAAIGVLRKFVDAGKMGDIRPEVMFQDFFAGRLGISMQSTAQLGRYNREIGGRFALKCTPYPLSATPARLPAAGNVAMIFAKDPAKQEAAWKFVKFACGPEGGTMMVKATGYIPPAPFRRRAKTCSRGFVSKTPTT